MCEKQPHMTSTFSRKAQVSFALKEPITLVLSIIGGLVLLGVAFTLKTALLSEKDDGELANFERLVATLQDLEQKPEKKHATVIYYLPKERALVAYDTLRSSYLPSSSMDKASILYAPSSCFADACICLYDIKKWNPQSQKEKDNGVISCKTLGKGKIISFYSEMGVEPHTKGDIRRYGSGHFVVYEGSASKPTFRLFIQESGADPTLTFFINPLDESNTNDIATQLLKKAIDS